MSKKKDFSKSISIKLPSKAAPQTAGAPGLKEQEHSVDTIPSGRGEIRQIDVERIVPSRYQPRHHFDETEMQELSSSIKEKGVLQPISVCRAGEGNFELIAGERRWRAAKTAGLLKVPAIVYDQRPDADELGLIENIQREDLLPEEIAAAIVGIMERHGYTQQEVAAVIGKEKSDVSKFCSIAAFVRSSDVSAFLASARKGHNSSLSKEVLYLAASRSTVEEGLSFLKNVVEQGINVREAREIIKAGTGRKVTRKPHAGIMFHITSFNNKLIPEFVDKVSSKEEASDILKEISKTRDSLAVIEKKIQDRFGQ